MKVKNYGHTEPQLVPKLLLHVSVRELHNNLVIFAYNGGLKEARDEDYNIDKYTVVLQLLVDSC